MRHRSPSTGRPPTSGWEPTSSRRRRRIGGASVALAGVALVVAGCLPDPKTTQGVDIANLYAVFLGAGIVVGAIVWVLATIAILRGRRRRSGEPAQTHGNVRIEAAVDGDPAGHRPGAVRADDPDAGQGGRQGHGRRQPPRHGLPLAVAGGLRRRGRSPRRHRRPAAGGRPARRPARPRHAGLGRREPRVLRPGVPVQARRDPGVADRVRPPGQRARGLPGSLRRVLRHRPRPDAVHDPRRRPGHVRRLAGGSKVRPRRACAP